MTDSVSVPVWFRTPGGGLIRRECLDPHEVGSTYHYVKYELGLDPSDYGIPENRPYYELNNHDYIKHDEWR